MKNLCIFREICLAPPLRFTFRDLSDVEDLRIRLSIAEQGFTNGVGAPSSNAGNGKDWQSHLLQKFTSFTVCGPLLTRAVCTFAPASARMPREGVVGFGVGLSNVGGGASGALTHRTSVGGMGMGEGMGCGYHGTSGGFGFALLAPSQSLTRAQGMGCDGGSHVAEQRLQQVLEDNRRVEMAFQRYVGVNWLWR